MCGISGVVSNDGQDVRRGVVQIMNDLLAHRGPDDSGILSFRNVTLGHRRLSIFDLSTAGHQPMESEDQRFVIVHNGEIYNFPELKEELSKVGRRFRTETDTEVILAAYSEWGSSCVERFNGMWAFVILDRARNELFLSRDRLGVKPLYYAHRGHSFTFASEIKAIVGGHPELRKPNYRYLYHFLPSGALDDGEETFFEGVRSFPAGSIGVLNLDTNQLAHSSFWDLDVRARQYPLDRNDPVGQLRALLEDSISLRLRADVPVGTCLSGGIDSSSIVALMSKQRSDRVHTYSGIYPDKDCDEKHFVDLVNARCGTHPHLITPEPRGDLLEILEKITWHQDEPTAGPGLYTQYFVMKEACKNVKVLLDGQGGDELFAGYIPYFGPRIQDMLNSPVLSERARGYLLAMQVSGIWGSQWVSGISDSPGTRNINRILRGLRGLRRAVSTQPEPPFFHADFSAAQQIDPIRRTYESRDGSVLSNTLYRQTLWQSIPALLHYEDRNSMAFSIEARVPLLDYRIVEFAFAIEDKLKINGSWTKWVLREATKDLLPREVTRRRSKLGYPTPFARWIREAADFENFRELLFSNSFLNRNLIPRDTVKYYWDQHMSGYQDRSWLLYRYATMELWFRHFIDDWHPTPAEK